MNLILVFLLAFSQFYLVISDGNNQFTDPPNQPDPPTKPEQLNQANANNLPDQTNPPNEHDQPKQPDQSNQRYQPNHPNSDDDYYNKCVNAIYRECTHQSEFTEQEIENARIYIQNRYNNLPNPYKPLRPPCKKLHVRKDFKCLTHSERLEFIYALRELYRNGEQTRLALWPHAAYWGLTHKFVDFFGVHRWQNNELEKALKRVNPKVSLPYWLPHEEYDQPELSILWDYLGRAGNRESDYCVKDGSFVDVKPCVKRKWVNDTHIRSWNSVEQVDALLQNVDALHGFRIWVTVPHFKIHLAVGGTEGQYSVPNAPYDFAFYAYHNWIMDPLFFKWQLQNDQQLALESYNQGYVYDWEIDRLRPSNLTRDRIIYFNVSTLETFQNTFGELCYVHDVIIEAINEITSNKRREMPLKYQKMPKDLLKKYYPKFYCGDYGPFDYLSHDVIECNRQCRGIRYAEDLTATVEGQALLERFKYLALFDLKPFLIDNDNFHKAFADDLNNGGYCSPYIIT